MGVELTWQSDLEFRATDKSDGHAVQLDAGHAISGTHNGQTPVEVLLSSLGGCMGISLMTTLRNYETAVESLTLELEAHKTENLPNRIESIDLVVHIITDIPKNRIERALQLSHDKYCTISNTINADIQITLIYNGEAIERRETDNE